MSVSAALGFFSRLGVAQIADGFAELLAVALGGVLLTATSGEQGYAGNDDNDNGDAVLEHGRPCSRCGSGTDSGRRVVRTAQLEGDDDLGDAADESADADPQDEQPRRTSGVADRPDADASSRIPDASSRPHSDSSSRSTMLRTMSKVPLRSRYQPTRRARMPKVWNGDISAMTPVITNSTPSTACSHFQPRRNRSSRTR